MPLQLTVTNAGRAAIVNAQNTGTAPVTIAQLGLTATAVAADPALTALAGEFKRIDQVGGAVVADDTIHMVAQDASADAYTVRAFGLYLQDGTLFALYGQAEPIVEKTAATIFLLANDIAFTEIDAAAITFGDTDFINPPATETVKGVAEIATQAESDAGEDDARIVTPRKLKTSVLAWFGGILADVWRASNDGSGSGLDADLLDGQHGSYYANIPARLGFTPLNAASYTAADIKTKLLTVDGSGSGLDADLLDGKGWTDGQDVRFGIVLARTPADGTTGGIRLAANPGTGLAYFQVLNANETAQYGYWKYWADGRADWSGSIWRQGNQVWDSANDGSGSGLDADMLDGQHGSYYANIPARLGYTPLDSAAYTAADVKTKLLTVDGSGSGFDADLLDGYHGSAYDRVTDFIGATTGRRVYADGYKRCWSQVTIAANQSVYVAFPFSFDAAPHVQCSAQMINITTAEEYGGMLTGSVTTAGFTIINGADFMCTYSWEAKGK